MRTCPQCGAELTDQAVLAGLCRACGVSLEDLVDDEPLSPEIPQTNRDTDADVMATMQFGPNGTGEGSPDAADVPADGDIGATIDVPPTQGPVGHDTDPDAVLRTIDLGE